MNDPIDVDLSDDDNNEVLGATSAKGMPLVREEMAEGLPLRPGSPPWQDEAGENIDINAGSPDGIDIEVDDIVDVDGGEKDAFGHAIDAFGHVIAPEVGVTMIKSPKIIFAPTPFNFSGCPRYICR